MSKNDKECKTLRDERVALEEAIKSLRAESEELRKNLTREFDQNDTLKAQMARLAKQIKELQEVNKEKIPELQLIADFETNLSNSRRNRVSPKRSTNACCHAAANSTRKSSSHSAR